MPSDGGSITEKVARKLVVGGVSPARSSRSSVGNSYVHMPPSVPEDPLAEFDAALSTIHSAAV